LETSVSGQQVLKIIFCGKPAEVLLPPDVILCGIFSREENRF
jgi:hypothetical protein